METPITNNLIVELHVPDFAPIKSFYSQLGFEIISEDEKSSNYPGYLVLSRKDPLGNSILNFYGDDDRVPYQLLILIHCMHMYRNTYPQTLWEASRHWKTTTANGGIFVWPIRMATIFALQIFSTGASLDNGSNIDPRGQQIFWACRLRGF